MPSLKISKKNLMHFFLALISSALMCAIFIPILLTYYEPMDSASYDYSLDVPDGQVVTDTKDWNVFLNEEGKVTPLSFDHVAGFDGLKYNGQTFYYSRVLDQELESPMLRIDVVNRSVSVFLDDALIYSDWPELDNRIGYLELPMQEWDRLDPVLVSLPTDYYGKTLTIAQSTHPLGNEKLDGSTTVYLCSVNLYCGYSYESGLISDATHTAYPAMVLFLLGAALLLLMVYQAFHGQTDWGLLFFAGYLFLYMGGIMVKAPFYIEYFPYDSAKHADLSTLSTLSAVTCLLFFLSTRFKGKFRWALCFFTLLQGASVVLSGLLQYHFSVYTFSGTVDLISLSALLAALVLGFIQFRLRNPFFRKFYFCLLVIAGGYFVFLLSSPTFSPEYWTSFQKRITAISISNLVMPLRALSLLLMICCLWAVTADFLRDQVEKASRQTALKLQEQMARESYSHIHQQAQETAMMRHDLLKHLNTLEGLLSGGQTLRAVNYIKEVSQESQKLKSVINTGNYILDILLNSRLCAALDEGIQVDIIRAEAPVSLPMTDSDLCSVLLNALDNAIHACSDPSMTNPWIRLDLHIKKQFFYISMENSALESERRYHKNKSLKTIKEHGYGTFIMERTIEKYGGIMQVKQFSGRFRVTLVLPLNPPENHSNA